MNQQNSHPKPNRRNQVTRQQRIQETGTEFSSSHVSHALKVHEQVMNDKRSIQEGKEATIHSTGHQ
jgi:hypothetical protein